MAGACRDSYAELCSFRNLELAYRRARKGKNGKKAVQEFECDLERNILGLRNELETHTYEPKPLKRFVIRDPKTRLISASDFRDRVIHHALCNIIQPIFEKTFIYDSHANQIGKGTSKALGRFDLFKRKASQNGRVVNSAKDNNMVTGYVLKADIRRFFDTVDHDVLMGIMTRRIHDKNVLELIRKILKNHMTDIAGKGMPIGNLTSQFFANVYLSELDCFVKHHLKAKYYIRYVDDFVLLDKSKERLESCKEQIAWFLKTLRLELHQQKSKIYPLHKGVGFLGFRVFHHYSLPKKSNICKMQRRLADFSRGLACAKLTEHQMLESLESWFAYAAQGDTFKLRKKIKREWQVMKTA